MSMMLEKIAKPWVPGLVNISLEINAGSSNLLSITLKYCILRYFSLRNSYAYLNENSD